MPPGRGLRPRCREVEVLRGELPLMKHMVLRDDRLDEFTLMVEDDVVDLPPLVLPRELLRDVRREYRILDCVGHAANSSKDPPRVVVVKGPQRLGLPTVDGLEVFRGRGNRQPIRTFDPGGLEHDRWRCSEPINEREDDPPVTVPERE